MRNNRTISTDIALEQDLATPAGRLARFAWSCEDVNTELGADVKTVLLERDALLRTVADLEGLLAEARASDEQLDLGMKERARLVAVRGLELVTERWGRLVA